MLKGFAGEKFGLLSVTEICRERVGAKLRNYFICDCACGASALKLDSYRVRTGKTQSCGCRNAELSKQRRLRHGMSNAPIYAVWAAMIRRCTAVNNKSFPDYGGRGITVCKRWRKFDNFLADMGVPSPGLTLERINNDGNYEKGNCKWATRKQQAMNRRARSTKR